MRSADWIRAPNLRDAFAVELGRSRQALGQATLALRAGQDERAGELICDALRGLVRAEAMLPPSDGAAADGGR